MLLTITDRASNGMMIIKEALLGAKAKEGVEMKITYMGAPKYMLSVTADPETKPVPPSSPLAFVPRTPIWSSP